MGNSSEIWSIVYSVAWSLPFLIFYIIGAILSIVFRKRLGRVWLLPLLAFLLHIFTGIVSLIIQNALSYYMLHGGDYHTYPLLAQTSGAITLFLRIVADVILLIALFARRGNESKSLM